VIVIPNIDDDDDNEQDVCLYHSSVQETE
jgi:hypothetical protein